MSGVKEWMFKARGAGSGPFGGDSPDQSASGGGGGGPDTGCVSDGDCSGNSVCRGGRCRRPNNAGSGSGDSGTDETGVDGSAATYQNYQQDMAALTNGIALSGGLSTTGIMGDFLANRINPMLQARYDAWRAANPKEKKNGMLDWMQSQQPYGAGGPDWITANADAENRKKKRNQQKNGTMAPGTAPQQMADQLYREGIGNYIDLAGFGQGSTRWSGF